MRSLRDHARVGVLVVGQRDHGLTQRPTPAAQPGGVVHVDLGAVALAAGDGERILGQQQVHGRIDNV
jgi:hypothetical protein